MGHISSVSIGWNIAREAFWSPAEAYVNLLKLRFSYGSLGNQNTDNYYPTYSIQNITVGSVDAGGRWLLDLANKSNIASSPVSSVPCSHGNVSPAIMQDLTLVHLTIV